jgi:hypothetical protein
MFDANLVTTKDFSPFLDRTGYLPQPPLNIDIVTNMLQYHNSDRWKKSLYSYSDNIEGKRMCKICAQKICVL